MASADTASGTEAQRTTITLDIGAPSEGLKQLFDHMLGAMQATKKFNEKMAAAEQDDRNRQFEDFREKFQQVANNVGNLENKMKTLTDAMEKTLGKDGLLENFAKLSEYIGVALRVVAGVAGIVAVMAAVAYSGAKALYGLGSSALSAGRRAAGSGSSIGGSKAFGAVFETSIGAGGLLGTVAKGRFDKSSQQSVALRVLGVKSQTNTAAMSVEVLVRAAAWSKKYSNEILDTVADACLITTLMSKQTLRQLQQMSPEELNELVQKYNEAEKTLALSEEDTKKWAHFVTSVDLAWEGMKTAFQRHLADGGVAAAIESLSTRAASLFDQFTDLSKPDSFINKVIALFTKVFGDQPGTDMVNALKLIADSFHEFWEQMKSIKKTLEDAYAFFKKYWDKLAKTLQKQFEDAEQANRVAGETGIGLPGMGPSGGDVVQRNQLQRGGTTFGSVGGGGMTPGTSRYVPGASAGGSGLPGMDTGGGDALDRPRTRGTTPGGGGGGATGQGAGRGEGTVDASGLSIRPGRRPNVQALDPRLVELYKAGASHLPEGYHAEVSEGYNPGGHAPNSMHHKLGQGAIDFVIVGPDGKELQNNGGSDPLGLYTQMHRDMEGEMKARYPQLYQNHAMGHGPDFETSRGSGRADWMHVDLGGARGTGMGHTRIDVLGPREGVQYGKDKAAVKKAVEPPKVETPKASDPPKVDDPSKSPGEIKKDAANGPHAGLEWKHAPKVKSNDTDRQVVYSGNVAGSFA